MSANEKSFNYGLPNRYPKLPKKFSRKVKSTFSKYASKSWNLCNPEPIPYQRDAFKPSTISKIIDIPKRFIDGFMDHDYPESQPQRGIIIHTGRYVFSNIKEIYKSQNERLIAEENYLKKVKYLKKMSDSRLKMQSQNLILEGENLLSSQQVEKPDVLPVSHNKGKPLFTVFDSNSGIIPPAPTIIDTSRLTERDHDQLDTSQPVSMAVQKIKLKNRIAGPDTISSAPVQSDQRTQGNMNSFFQNSTSKSNGDKLPPIVNIHKEFDNHGRQSDISFNSHSDYESAYRQSERLNRPNARINEYIMDGISVKFTERSDIQGEIRYLKSIILPSIARELYVGRGIQLPPNHATKIPRGKYVDDNIIKNQLKNSELKLDTPGGGSVTINTTTPVSMKSTPDKLQYVNNIPNSIPETTPSTEHMDNSNMWKEIMEQINNNVNKNNDGFMESQTLKNILLQNPSFSDKWKVLATTVFDSVNLINEEQLKVLFETQNICHHFQADFPNFEVEEAKQLIPFIFNEFCQSENLLKIDHIFQLLTNSNQILVSQQQIDELYDEFSHLISEIETFSHENIPKFHSLLFIPYLLRKLENKS